MQHQGFESGRHSCVGVVCAGLESKSLPMIQRVGRHSIPEGKRRVYILYVADSQEEKWMDQATQDFTQCSTVNHSQIYSNG